MRLLSIRRTSSVCNPRCSTPRKFTPRTTSRPGSIESAIVQRRVQGLGMSNPVEASEERLRPPCLRHGALSTVVISRGICNGQRFNNRRQVSSYTGLCPGEYSSGSKRVTGSVTKHGNGRLRAALVELAWRLLRYQPRYHAVQKRLTVLAKGARATRSQHKSHCRRGSSARCQPLETSYWTPHTRSPRI